MILYYGLTLNSFDIIIFHLSYEFDQFALIYC